MSVPEPQTEVTEGDVRAALSYLQMTNPKPEVPVHQTIVGYLIVAVARKLRELETRTEPNVLDIFR